MKLNANHVDMLYRVALTEYWTSPSTPAKYDRFKVIEQLETAGLIIWDGGKPLRLTDNGRMALALNLDEERVAQLEKLRLQRERTDKKGPKS